MDSLSNTLIKVLLIFLSLNTELISAQNYEAVKTDATTYFYDSVTMDIIPIRIDSVAITGNEIQFSAMRQIRPTDYSCYIIDGASWLGDEVVEKPDGTFVFTIYPISPGDSAQTYRIQTHAGLNQPWNFYNYHFVNHHIEANVTGIVIKPFLELTDSVKVITLFRKDALGQVVSDPINSQKILLSKNYGLIRLPKFDDLPYLNKFYDIVGKTNPETGITNINTMQIFDFEPGDEFHTVYYDRYFSIPYPETTISTIMKVLSKIPDLNGSSVTYVFEQCQSSSYKLSDTNSTITYRFDTISQTYSTELTPEFESEPLEPVMLLSNNWMIKTTMGLSNDPLFPFPDKPYKAIPSLEAYSFNSQECYIPVMIDGCLTSIYYFKGLGGPYYQCSEISWGPSWNLLKYYKKGSETWGTPLDCDSLLKVSITESPLIQKVKIYPNPTSGTIMVSIPENIQFPCTLEIFDISGRFLRAFTLNQQTQSFDLSNIPAGLYNYKVTTTKGETFRGKIIRQ